MSKKRFTAMKIITYILYVMVVLFAFLALSVKFSIGGLKLLTVMSGSMNPTIKTGSMIIDRTQSSYRVGEIVTFKDRRTSELITHRIIREEESNGQEVFVTRGDANPSDDSDRLTNDRIIGKVIFKIPLLGYPVAFARTWPGVIILIVIPATIIIYDEINNIKKELVLRKKRGKKEK